MDSKLDSTAHLRPEGSRFKVLRTLFVSFKQLGRFDKDGDIVYSERERERERSVDRQKANSLEEMCFLRGRFVSNFISLEEKQSSTYFCLKKNFIIGNAAKCRFFLFT